jgi:hypothetical protein
MAAVCHLLPPIAKQVDRQAAWTRALLGVGYEEAVLYCHQVTGISAFAWISVHGEWQQK